MREVLSSVDVGNKLRLKKCFSHFEKSPEFLEAWLALTSVNYNRKVEVSILLNHCLAGLRLKLKLQITGEKQLWIYITVNSLCMMVSLAQKLKMPKTTLLAHYTCSTQKVAKKTANIRETRPF